MIQSIRYNLANLGNFNGRDARSTFWWYMLFLILIQIVLTLVVSIPMYVEMFGAAFEAAQTGADPEQLNAAMLAGLGDNLRSAAYFGTAISFISAGLFSASFVRRLHDSGKPGWWLILALAPFLYTASMNVINLDQVIAMTESAMTQTDPQKALGDQSRLYMYSIIGWAGYLVSIIFGVLESDDGPNAYGEQPTPMG